MKPTRAWLALAAVMLAGSLLAWPLPAALLDWQPERAFREPWRAFTAAFVHWSESHLVANLLGAVLLAALGWAGRLPTAAAAAWFAAWPLLHLGLLLRPALAHYGGLSGVLHAGVAVATLWLVVQARGPRRAVGAMVAMGLVAKVALEHPFGDLLQTAAGLDIAVAPIAHATGVIAGFACAGAALAWHQNRAR
jgi:rhomboid family GlyGly-CTERM serine protease